MPLGASRLAFLSKTAEATAAQRTALTLDSSNTSGTSEIDTAQYKFGGSSFYQQNGAITVDADELNTELGGNTWTYECWFRNPDQSNNQYISFTGNYSTDDWLLYFYGSINRVQLYSGGDGWSINDTSITSGGSWHHIAWTNDNGSHALYVDGTRAGTNTSSGSTKLGPTGSTFALAGGVVSGTNDCHIDEIRISSSVRYTGASFTVPTAPFVNDSDTVLLCHADGTDGDTVFIDDNGDRAPEGIQANGGASISTAQSQFGSSSFAFDGTNDYLEVDTDNSGNFDFAQNDFTVECWVRPDSTTGQRSIIIGKSQTASIHLEIVNGVLRVGRTNAAWDITGTTSLSNNTWYHVALVRSGNTKTLYLDGSSEGTKDVTGINEKFSDYLNIGAYIRGYNFFDGHIDEVRISDNARYTSNFTPSTTAFTNDSNTLLLLHGEQHDADTTVIFDDNGGTLPTYSITYGTAEYAVELDGSNDGFYASSAISPSTTAWTYVAWFRTDTTSAQKFLWEDFENGKPPVQISLESGGYINILVKDSTNATKWQARESGAVSASTWHCLLASYDPSAGTASAYLYTKGNGTPNAISNSTSPATATFDTNMYNSTKSQGIWQRGYNGILRFDGAVSDTWFDTSYIDFTSSSNRQKFVSATGAPVDLGSDGSTPTGSAPDFFFSGPASSYGTNLGSGPSTTADGSATDYTSSTPAS